MIRSSLAASSAHASMLVSAGRGLAFQRRRSSGGSSASTSGGSGQAPMWVKLERRDTILNAYRSADGTNWTFVGADTIAAGASVYVGLAVTSHNKSLATTAMFDGVAVTAIGGLPNQPPTVSLTAPTDGAAFTAPATIQLSASAGDPEGALSRVDFFAGSTLLGSDASAPYSYTWSGVAAGSYTLSAVAHDAGGSTAQSPARSVTVVNAPPPNQPPTVALTAPASGATYTAPASIAMTAAAADTDGSVTRVDFYANGSQVGSDAATPFAFTWTGVASGTHSLTAIALDDDGATRTSGARSVTVSANQSPTVSLTAPANGATYTAPATIALTATAGDPDGTVARVDFYAGSTLIQSDTSSPYTASWSSVGEGSYALTAVARDNSGNTTVSSTRTVTVTGTPVPTRAEFGASTNHDTAVDRYLLEIYAAGATPGTDAPIATQELGKPAVVDGECESDVAQTIVALTPGSYFGTVTAIGPDGQATSAPSPAFTR
jgi:hypothetical protein